MALLPYSLIETSALSSPLIVDSPHSGRIYPADFAYACPLPLLRQAEDAFMDEIAAGAVGVGGAVLAAEFPRSMIDVNRAESDIDPASLKGVWPHELKPEEMTLSGFGLVRHMCRNGISLYRENLTVEEVQRRITTYYRPYHDSLSKLVAARLKKFGTCYLLDMHSMPARIGVQADFILGDRDGTSCDTSFTFQAKQILENMGYQVGLNDPYKGREIIMRYGLKGQGAHALQIEINRKLYMDEIEIEKNADFERLQKNMSKFFRAIAELVSIDEEKLAAE